jgi:methylated-DNA-[protein]-cysteine S-methyltransferase
MDTPVFSHLESPLGTIRLDGQGDDLVGLYLDDHPAAPPPDPAATRADDALADARHQLEQYFAGERTTFDLPLAPRGTPFQLEVWAALAEIPYGDTASYRDIAERIGRPTSTRAVGAANGRNPLSIVVPCHRVIGADGSLTGYGWGVERKVWLLDHERAHR